MKSEKVLLFSGGVDSYIAYHYLNKPQTVYFDLKNRYSKREIPVIKKLIPETIIDSSLNLAAIEHDSGYIPYRNLFLAMMATAKYSDTVVIAGLKDDVVSDKNEEAFNDFSAQLSKLEKNQGRSIQVVSPFWGFTKAQVVQWFLAQHPDKRNILLETISCYSGSEGSNYCGSCESCFRKWVALRYNGYDIPFHSKEILAEYKRRCEAGRYDALRRETTLKVIDEYNRS